MIEIENQSEWLPKLSIYFKKLKTKRGDHVIKTSE